MTQKPNQQPELPPNPLENTPFSFMANKGPSRPPPIYESTNLEDFIRFVSTVPSMIALYLMHMDIGNAMGVWSVLYMIAVALIRAFGIAKCKKYSFEVSFFFSHALAAGITYIVAYNIENYLFEN